MNWNRWPIQHPMLDRNSEYFGLRKKYKKKKRELIGEIGNETRVLSIKLIAQSKLEGNWLYDCEFVKGGHHWQTNIMARDVTEALFKLDKIHNMGMSKSLMEHTLTSPNFSELYSEWLSKQKE
jgi:hypothetical protein